MKQLFFGLLLIISFISCSDSNNATNPILTPNPDSLDNIPTAVTIEGRVYTINTSIWQDRMPPLGPEKSGLIAVVNLIATDSMPIPEQIDIIHLSVFSGDSLWQVGLKETVELPEDYVLQKVARDGPVWEEPSEATVVVVIQYNRAVYYVKQENVGLYFTF